MYDKMFGLAGIGPGLSFARDLVGFYRQGSPDLTVPSNPLIGLIPTAVGGTAIEHWCQDGLLFQNMTKQVTIGMRKAVSSGYKPRLAGLLFYQGESDAVNEALSLAYESRLEVKSDFV